LALAALVESEVRQLEPMEVLRFLALLLHWVEALEVILTLVKIMACQEARAEEVLEVVLEQAAQVLLGKALRAVRVVREPHTLVVAVVALVLLAAILPHVQAA
jgi:hypothetical protein